jgi:hypothetical protein
MPNPTKHNDTKHLLFDVLLGVCGCSRVYYGISWHGRLCTYVRALRHVLTASETWGKPPKFHEGMHHLWSTPSPQWGDRLLTYLTWYVHCIPIIPLLYIAIARGLSEITQRRAAKTRGANVHLVPKEVFDSLCTDWVTFLKGLCKVSYTGHMPLVTQALRSTEFDWSAPITAPTWKPLEPKVWPAEPDRAQGDHGQNLLKYH